MITLFKQRHTLICKVGFIFLAALDAFGSPTAKITISNACESSLAPSKSRQPCLNRLFSHYCITGFRHAPTYTIQFKRTETFEIN